MFPVLFILTTITFLLQYLKHTNSTDAIVTQYFLNITLLKGFSSDYFLTGIGPGWSLSVEELFYFLSPLLFLLLKKKSALLYILLSVYAVGLILTLVFSRIDAAGFFSSFQFTFYFTFFGRVFEFLCGIYLAMIVKGKYSNSWLKNNGVIATYIGLAVIALAVLFQYWIAKTFEVLQGSEHWSGLLVNNIMMPIGITLLFYGLIYYKSPVQWLLGSSLLVQLGNSTYSFYLLHTSFLLSWVKKYLSNNLFIIFLAIVVSSFLFYKVVEQPLARALRKRFTLREVPG